MRKGIAFVYLVYCAAIFLGIMLFVCPLVILATSLLKKLPAKRVALFLLKVWAALFSWFSGFWIRIKYEEQINTTQSHIYVGNHGSYLDAVAVAYSIPQVFSPLGKVEMVKIPVFGWIYERVVILIDRSNKESREESVATLKRELDENISVLLFPEGTMNQTDEPLAPFFDGAFRIALETQTPIMPFVLVNSKKLFPRKDPLRAHPGIITVVFGTPVPVFGKSQADIEHLKAEVFDQMLGMINRHS